MLQQFIQLWLFNDSGQNLVYNDGGRINLRTQEWKISSGALAYQGTTNNGNWGFEAGETFADQTSLLMPTVLENTLLSFGVNGTLTITHDNAAADGNFKLYMEFAEADGSFPSDLASATDFDITDLTLVKTLPIANTAVDKARSVNFKLE